MPKWRYRAKLKATDGTLATERSTDLHPGLPTSEEDGLANVEAVFDGAKRNHEDKLRWVSLERSEKGYQWDEVKRLSNE
jgi:hypothetical protein